MSLQNTDKPRLRAPSARSLKTRRRILDAAEVLFSERGFDGASLRDIARRAEVPVALVHHHGGGKDTLFAQVIARRAEELATARLAALTLAKTLGPLDLRGVLDAFLRPFLTRALTGGPEWHAYGRLIAHVSADTRWRPITEAEFDPVVQEFLKELALLLPGVSPARLGAGFVFTVSAMLSLCASEWRIEALGGVDAGGDRIETLLDFCVAGFEGNLSAAP